MLVKDVAVLWQERLHEGNLSAGSQKIYRWVLGKHVIGTDKAPAPLAHLTLGQLTAGGIA